MQVPDKFPVDPSGGRRGTWSLFTEYTLGERAMARLVALSTYTLPSTNWANRVRAGRRDDLAPTTNRPPMLPPTGDLGAPSNPLRSYASSATVANSSPRRPGERRVLAVDLLDRRATTWPRYHIKRTRSVMGDPTIPVPSDVRSSGGRLNGEAVKANLSWAWRVDAAPGIDVAANRRSELADPPTKAMPGGGQTFVTGRSSTGLNGRLLGMGRIHPDSPVPLAMIGQKPTSPRTPPDDVDRITLVDRRSAIRVHPDPADESSGVLRVTLGTVRWDLTSWTPSASRCPRTYCTPGGCPQPAGRHGAGPVPPMFDGPHQANDTGRSGFRPWWDPGRLLDVH